MENLREKNVLLPLKVFNELRSQLYFFPTYLNKQTISQNVPCFPPFIFFVDFSVSSAHSDF